MLILAYFTSALSQIYLIVHNYKTVPTVEYGVTFCMVKYVVVNKGGRLYGD